MPVPPERDKDLWQALGPSGEVFATEEDYEHGYVREVRGDLEQYVAFEVSQETYAVAITQIAEISKPMRPTAVPRTADFVIGIANVRGTVIPIIDLARRLGLGAHPPTRRSRVLIVRQEGELCGVLVDGVIGVVPIAPEHLEEAPGAIGGTRGDFVRSLARYEGAILIVLDLDVVLRPEDFVRSAPPRRSS